MDGKEDLDGVYRQHQTSTIQEQTNKDTIPAECAPLVEPLVPPAPTSMLSQSTDASLIQQEIALEDDKQAAHSMNYPTTSVDIEGVVHQTVQILSGGISSHDNIDVGPGGNPLTHVGQRKSGDVTIAIVPREQQFQGRHTVVSNESDSMIRKGSVAVSLVGDVYSTEPRESPGHIQHVKIDAHKLDMDNVSCHEVLSQRVNVIEGVDTDSISKSDTVAEKSGDSVRTAELVSRVAKDAQFSESDLNTSELVNDEDNTDVDSCLKDHNYESSISKIEGSQDDDPAVDAQNTCLISSDTWSQSLCQGMGELWQKRVFCDITLQADDGNYLWAHKCIMAASSQKLYELMMDTTIKMESTPESELTCTPRVVAIPGISYHILDAVVTFIYCGKVEVSCKDLDEVYRTASILQLPQLQAACRQIPGANAILRTYISAGECGREPDNPETELHDVAASPKLKFISGKATIYSFN